MKIFNKFKDTRGFVSGYNRVVRFRYMITEEAKRRVALAYWEKCGTKETEKDLRSKKKNPLPLEKEAQRRQREA